MGDTQSNLVKIAAAITASETTVEQQRAATTLIEKYIERFAKDNEKFRVLAVENPWFLWLDDNTVIVGVMDANRFDIEHKRYEDLELKTRRAPRFKNNGEPYKGDTEQDWMNELASSPQVGIYALARMRATFLTPLPPVAKPYIRVRAAVKSDGKVTKPSPVMIWPKEDDGLFTFPQVYLKIVESGLLNCAASIRARREQGSLPWQLRGSWCSRFGRDCEMLSTVCAKEKNGEYIEPVIGKARTDPGAMAREVALKTFDGDTNSLVILSASGYTDYCACAEYWRLKTGGWFEKEDSQALGVGTCFHAAIAELNKQIMEEQNGN